ncbi:hypothetical protein [Pedobacter nototheniae]|uniref:hypothetical protein n=1 Tax=Pedobacter nototheniae TaxID=2488994 RepID=UPI00292F3786|nr:hypothetical protein [Pedobacter nototheniae]
MKKNLILTALAGLCLIISCKKDVNQTESYSSASIKNGLKATLPGDNPAASAIPVVYENGEYKTAYAGGLNFGPTFTYPTTVTAAEYGQSWSPSYSGPTSQNNLLSFLQDDSRFSAFFGTFVNGIGTAVGMYYTDWHSWILNSNDGSSSPPAFTVQRYGGSADGIILITGQFIKDPTSPTHVSIVSQTYIPPNQQPNSETINGYLGTVTLGADVYQVEGNDGIITRVIKNTNGVLTEITDFSGIYLIGRNGTFIAVDITLFPNTPNEVVYTGVRVQR